MGTRCDIIVQRADGSYARIYCHWDGYLEGVGATLAENFATQELAEGLTALGDCSSIAGATRLAPKPGVAHSFDSPAKGVVVAYGRDRGEKNTEAKTGATLAEVWPSKDTWTEYTYVFAPMPGGANEPKWYVGDPDLGPSSLVLLELALKDPENFAPQPDVKSPWGVLWHRDETRAKA